MRSIYEFFEYQGEKLNMRLYESETRHKGLIVKMGLELEQQKALQLRLKAQMRNMVVTHQQSVSYYENELNRMVQERLATAENHNAEKLKFLEEKRDLRAELLSIEFSLYDDTVHCYEKITNLNSLVATRGFDFTHDNSSRSTISTVSALSTVSQEDRPRRSPVANHDFSRGALEVDSPRVARAYLLDEERETDQDRVDRERNSQDAKKYPSKGHKKSTTIAGLAGMSGISGIFSRRNQGKQNAFTLEEDDSIFRPALSRRDGWRGSPTMFQSRMLDDD